MSPVDGDSVHYGEQRTAPGETTTYGTAKSGRDPLLESDPRYMAHFTHPIYEADADESAPFGSDEGADFLEELRRGIKTITPGMTLADLMEERDVEEPFALAADNDVDGLIELYCRGFALLRFTGHLSADDRAVLRRALEGLTVLDGMETITDVVIPDLDSYPATDEDTAPS